MHTIDPLTGSAPTWRPGFHHDEPIYRSVVADYGVPGRLTGPSTVIPGELSGAGTRKATR